MTPSPLTTDLRYMDGSYLAMTGGTWHLDDSPWKAAQVVAMLERHGLQPATVCEIGCGAGGILQALKTELPDARFVGYDISPQAHELSRTFADARCEFVLGDGFDDPATFDLALAMDVVEHVEDCFKFARQVGRKARWKMFHLPLDAYVSGILRGSNSWDSAGHLHLFTAETAVKTIASSQHVLDWWFPRGAPLRREWTSRLGQRVGRLLPPRWAARLVDGSILVLAE